MKQMLNLSQTSNLFIYLLLNPYHHLQRKKDNYHKMIPFMVSEQAAAHFSSFFITFSNNTDSTLFYLDVPGFKIPGSIRPVMAIITSIKYAARFPYLKYYYRNPT